MYLVRHTIIGCLRVMKIVLADSPLYDVLKNEAVILKHLDHHQIPKLYDVFSDKDALVMILEYVDGETLSEYLDRNRVEVQNRIYGMILSICDVVGYLHQEKHIVHLDIKSDNLIIRGDEVYLIDFGNARMLDGSNDTEIMGSAGYSAPEQYYGADMGIETDIFQLGKLIDIICKRCGIDDPALERIVKKCIRQSASRYTCVTDIVREIERITGKSDRTAAQKKSILIGMFGVHAGAGVTFTSIAMANVIAGRMGCKVAVLECNRSGTFEKLEDQFFVKNGKSKDEDFFVLSNVTFVKSVRKDDIVSWQQKGFDFLICDLGISGHQEYRMICFDRYFLVGSTQRWRHSDYMHIDELEVFPDGVTLLLIGGEEIPGELPKCVTRYERVPIMKSPFGMNREEQKFYEKCISSGKTITKSRKF